MRSSENLALNPSVRHGRREIRDPTANTIRRAPLQSGIGENATVVARAADFDNPRPTPL